MPKFTQIAVSPSYLFALGEDGVVYQLVEDNDAERVTSSGLVVVNERKCKWVPADQVTTRR